MFAAIRRASGLIVIKVPINQSCFKKGIPTRGEGIMTNLSKLIFAAAIAAASIASPALAAHKGKLISAHQNGYVTRSSQERGVYNFVPASPPTENLRDPRTWVGDPASRPYVYIPGMAEGGN